MLQKVVSWQIKYLYNIYKAYVLKKAVVSNYIIAKQFRELKITIKNNIKDFFLIGLGIFSASFGVNGFLLANNFIDGGVTGISMLLSILTPLELSTLIFLINIPFIYLGYKVVNLNFAIKSSIAIFSLAFVLHYTKFPEITHDNLLIAVFGGFLLGAGIGLNIRGGAVIDGTEILAIWLSKKISVTIGDVIMIINIIIFSIAAYFLSIETAMYSLITYLAASKTLDFVVEGIEEYIGVTIISSHYEELRQMIINKLGRGVTIYTGKGGYGKRGKTREVDILYTVITRLELSKLKVEIEKIDPNSFVVMNSLKDIKGGMIKKRPLSK
jgi:uncharacterized membrane-anchored protein YitT (DUF2179 family)